MNEKLQYADMLEIPVSTTSITYKRIKKKRAKKPKVSSEDVKNELIEKVNAPLELTGQDQEIVETQVRSKRKGFSIVSLQLCVIALLVVVILVSTVTNPNSGINVFLNQVFGGEQIVDSIDERTYEQFSPVFASSESGLEYVIENGNTTVNGTGTAYAPVDGKVESITLDGEGKYSLTVYHSENFSSVISGLTFCYADVGDQIKAKIPVGYSAEKTFTLCFLDGNDAVLTGYQIVNNQVVWGV